MDGIVHTPFTVSTVPDVTEKDSIMIESPWSKTVTFFAVYGPKLSITIIQVVVSPGKGSVLSAVFVTLMSADCTSTESHADAASFDVTVSSCSVRPTLHA